MEQAITLCDQAELMSAKLKAVEEITALANTTFSKVSSQLRRAVSELKKVLENNGEDFSNYTDESKGVVLRSVKFVQLLKAMIDTPILDEDGNLVLSTEKRINDFDAVVSGKKEALENLPA